MELFLVHNIASNEIYTTEKFFSFCFLFRTVKANNVLKFRYTFTVATAVTTTFINNNRNNIQKFP